MEQEGVMDGFVMTMTVIMLIFAGALVAIVTGALILLETIWRSRERERDHERENNRERHASGAR